MARNKIIEMVAELSRLTSRCEANAILIYMWSPKVKH
jgi:hypothetical protein